MGQFGIRVGGTETWQWEWTSMNHPCGTWLSSAKEKKTLGDYGVKPEPKTCDILQLSDLFGPTLWFHLYDAQIFRNGMELHIKALPNTFVEFEDVWHNWHFHGFLLSCCSSQFRSFVQSQNSVSMSHVAFCLRFATGYQSLFTVSQRRIGRCESGTSCTMPALELENCVFQHRKQHKTGWFCDTSLIPVCRSCFIWLKVQKYIMADEDPFDLLRLMPATCGDLYFDKPGRTTTNWKTVFEQSSAERKRRLFGWVTGSHLPETFCGVFANCVPSPAVTLLYKACFGVVCKCAKCIEMSEFDVADCRCVYFLPSQPCRFPTPSRQQRNLLLG